MAGRLQGFFHNNANCCLYLQYLNFFIPLVMFSFIKTHRRLPAALAQGLLFIFPIFNCRLPWKQFLAQLEDLLKKKKTTKLFP